MSVPNQIVGSIIGKGGSVINSLMLQSGGCKIQMQQKEDMAPGMTRRGVTLTGTPQQIAEAEKLLFAIVEQSGVGGGGSSGGSGGGGGGGGGFSSGYSGLGSGFGVLGLGQQTKSTMSVPLSSVGSIIGKGGGVIKKLMEEAGCNIKLQQKEEMRPDQTDREVYITGTPHQIDHATRLVKQIVDQGASGGSGGYYPPPAGAPSPYGPPAGYGQVQQIGGFVGQPQPGSMKKSIMVQDAHVGSLIGRQGAVIKQLSAESGCHLQIQQKAERPGGEREVTLSGSHDQIERASALIFAILDPMANYSGSQGGGSYQALQTHDPYGSQQQQYNPYGGPPPGLAYGAPAAPWAQQPVHPQYQSYQAQETQYQGQYYPDQSAQHYYQ